MTRFNNTAIDGEIFLYQRGLVSTTIPWGRPTYNKIKTFLINLKNDTDILNNYDVYIMGGVLFDFNTTWDFDISLVGGTQTNEKLEEDLNYMTDLSLNNLHMLIDPMWYETRPENLTYSGMTNNGFLQQNIIHKKVGHIRKQIGESVEELDLRNKQGIISLSQYLIQGNYGTIIHKDKMINKVQNNPNPITITTFSVNEFLENDENYFLTHTNR